MKDRTKMTALALALLLCLSLAACGGAEGGGSLWDSALYTEDTELGEGAKTPGAPSPSPSTRTRSTCAARWRSTASSPATRASSGSM